MKISKKDEKYFEQFPADPDFSVEHNKRVMAETIKETDQMRKRKDREYDQPYQERSQAVTRYVKSLQQGRGSKDIKTYFGRRELARLRGEEVLARIQDQLTVMGEDGKVIRRGGKVK